ncbi:hypothetical protein BB561_002129 [Smittium simulii]|uniref:BAR domain-containing protein n=1 Tax=Smittium simulii TaxID=133385 RepID=A0A2T9YRK7_9FUNG|nr:hypothetical protein BB561_002129 [Smittium simulii]
MDQFTNFTRKFSENLTPFAEKVGSNFTQFRQMASEKIGTSAPLTDLPRDYLETQKRFDSVRKIHAELLRLSKKYALDDGTVDLAKIQTQFIDLSHTIGDKISSMGSTSSKTQPQPDQQPAEKHQTIQHQLSHACIDNAEASGLEEPLGASLYKFGSVYDKIGDLRLKMNNDIMQNVVGILQSDITSNMNLAQNSRKDVQGARLALDSLKSSLKNVSSSKQAAITLEVEKAEEIFVTAIEDSLKLMNMVLGSPVVIESIRNFAAAQLEFFKDSEVILGTLVSELDEIKLTQDALYYAGNDN